MYTFVLISPSNIRNWQETDNLLSEISINNNLVNISNVRNFKHIDLDNYEVDYYDKAYDIEKIESLYYIVEPFSKFDWPAHTMLSFWFEGGSYLVVSSEIRKEIWESFWPIKWMLNNYELLYVFWDESDLIKLRANIRKDEVRLYPIKAEKELIKKIFLSIINKQKELINNPEFYNTITNNCTTNIVYNVENASWKDLKTWLFDTLLPAYSDRFVYDLWLIDTKLSFEEARKYYTINDLSNKYADDNLYSEKIRVEKN